MYHSPVPPFSLALHVSFILQEEEMERSEARNDRVAQILSELGSTETVARPTWSPGETPDKVRRRIYRVSEHG